MFANVMKKYLIVLLAFLKRAIHNGTNWQDDGAKKDTMGLGKRYEWG